MTNLKPLPPDDTPALPIVPSAERWRKMSPAAREDYIAAATEALNQADFMSEGKPHQLTTGLIVGTLRDFVDRAGRHIYLASNLPILYPDEAPFSPDLIAVADMDDPGDADTRTGWSVVTEGRGIDLALEVIWHGDRNKDLVRNVAWFARLGIPEYFVYDRMRQRLYGYRPGPTPGVYVSMPVHQGRLRSEVLDLELGIIDGKLRFFLEGGSVVPESRELLDRANRLLDDVDTRIKEAETARQAAEAAREQAETAREQAETAREAAEAALEAEKAAREQAERRAAALEAELVELRKKFGL